jgi:hypothetical protein
MPKQFNNRVILPGSREIKITGEFTREEWNTLARCHNSAVQSLGGNALVSKIESQPLYEMLTDVATGDTITSFEVPESELKDLAARLRPFVLSDESTFLPKVCDHIKSQIDSKEVRDYLDSVIQVFDGSATLKHMEFGATVVVNSDEFFTKWLTTKVLDLTPELEGEVDRGLTALNPVMWQHILMHMLVSKVACLQHVCALIAALDVGKNFTLSEEPVMKLRIERLS